MASDNLHDEAVEVARRCGARAGQVVVDNMVAAVRDGDMIAVHRWDMIGQIIDSEGIDVLAKDQSVPIDI